MDIANKPPGVHGNGNSERHKQIMNTFGAFAWTFNRHYDIQWMFLYWLCMDLNELLLQRMQRKEHQFIPGPCAYI